MRLLPPPDADLPPPIREPERIAAEIGDASGHRGQAQALYRPCSEAELSAVLVEATRCRVPVTVVAARTSTTGGSVPEGGWIVSTLRLRRILAIDARGRTARAEAGVTLGDLQRAVAAEGLLYPPDPTSRDECSLGGTLACNASGARSFLYGATRRWVRSLRIVLASGEILALQRGDVVARGGADFELLQADGRVQRVPAPRYRTPRTTKHAGGYATGPDLDLVDLFIGSEGTLGVVSEVEVALLPAPEQVVGLFCFFPGEAEALALVEAARASGRGGAELRPRCLEWLDEASLGLVRERLPELPIPVRARCAVFSEEECGAGGEGDVLARWSARLRECGALAEEEQGVLVALSQAEHERFRAARHAVPAGVNAIAARRGMPKLGSDLAVPAPFLAPMLSLYRRAGEDPWSLLEDDARAALVAEFGSASPPTLRRVVFGHAGDAHLHLNLLPESAAGLALARAVHARLVREAIACGGSPAAEHGIGKIRHAALRQLVGEEGIEAMRTVKRALDPMGLLGRGNLFPA